MDINKEKLVKLVEDSIPKLTEALHASCQTVDKHVRLFGTASWLDALVNEIKADDSFHQALERIMADAYEKTVVPGLNLEECQCGNNHEELTDIHTAYRDSKPLLVLQRSTTGKLYLAYRFLGKVNSSMAIELGGRVRDGALRLSCSDIEEMMFRAGPNLPMKNFVNTHIGDVKAWAEKMETLDIPHILAFAQNYKKWKPSELRQIDKGVESKWDQHVENCEGKVKNLHIGNLGNMYRCHLCCYQTGCQEENALCAEQAGD